jgi:DNA end-binding protein Ku
VRSLSELEIDKADVKPAELTLAMQLIEQSATDEYDPKAYVDEVKKRIEAAVQQKIEGKEVTLAAEADHAGAQVIDLMEALRASLSKGTPAAPAPAAAQSDRKPPKRAAPTEAAAGTRAKSRKAS